MTKAYYKFMSKETSVPKDTLDVYDKITETIVISGYDNFIRINESSIVAVVLDCSTKSSYTNDLASGYTIRIKADNKIEFTTELLKMMAIILSNKYLENELMSSEALDFRRRYNKPIHFIHNGLTKWLYRKLAEISLPYLHIGLIPRGSVETTIIEDLEQNKTTINSIVSDLSSGMSYSEFVNTRGYSHDLSKELETFGFILNEYFTEIVKKGRVSKLCYTALLAEIRYIETIIEKLTI